ncbi:prolyl 4-hydroxylase subunit alpha-2-like [Babylonia areolata]|uniref:prolyl 4-hydroxylase subunit alpha-2-like n=1 Tax=Babylonia areolata TaxID=304850 RepID=UPI003FCEEFE7
MLGTRTRRDVHQFFLLILLLVVVIVAAVCAGQSDRKELYSSVSKMKTLPGTERQVLKTYEKVLNSLPVNTATLELRRKIENIERVNSKYVKNATLMENPFHAFRLIKRMVKQWSSVFRASSRLVASSRGLFKGAAPEFLNSTREWLKVHGIRWPSAVDLAGAASALVRLHQLYHLDYPALLKGRFLNMTSPPLTSLELTYVTRAAVDLGYICDAKELFAALEKAVVAAGRGDLLVGTVTECDHNSSFNIPSIDSLASASVQKRKDAVRAMYHQLCRKSMKTAVVYGSGEQCYWQSTHIPYLRFKADVVNSDPFIVVFHDVINDDEMREMKELSFGKISPSSLAVEEVKQENHLVRVSQNAWLFDVSPIISRLSRRVHHVTGLSTRLLQRDTHAEPYQVLNYGLGGVFGPHEDSVRVSREQGRENTPQLRNAGDRTATWMYYLSDVPLGGATAFPLLGAAIRPQKGTAVLWYNLKRSGQGDVRTVHAGCPVLYGDKWVANKWLREAGNTFTWPCLLNPDL